MTSNSVAGPAISTLPKGGGTLQGMGESFAAQAFSGTASFSLPFEATPCRGHAPSIGVNYSSGQGNGVCGMGTSIDLPSFSRKTNKGTPQYTAQDSFVFNGATLVRTEDSPRNETIGSTIYWVYRYQPRTVGDYTIIEQWQEQNDENAFWKTISPGNEVAVYGYSTQAIISNPENTAQQFEWLIERSWDSKGNYQYFEYKAEDGVGRVAGMYEENRTQFAQRYISKIYYGNQTPCSGIDADVAAQTWMFEIAFDYGEYQLQTATLPAPQTAIDQPFSRSGTWIGRQDAFSNYNAGFEIRTYRLCRNILMFHHFEAEFGTAEGVLVKAMSLQYDETPNLSTLIRAVETGYQYNPTNSTYDTKSFAPTDLSYTDFSPFSQEFEPLKRYPDFPMPGLDSGPYQLIDLYREGLPGVLYNDRSAVYYMAPLLQSNPQGELHVDYAAPTTIADFPNGNASITGLQFADVDNDGNWELLANLEGQYGYFEQQGDSWSGFMPFQKTPSIHDLSSVKHVDATGDGLIDLVELGPQGALVYPSLGTAGYEPAILNRSKIHLPTIEHSEEVLTTFSDFLGSGQSHFVKISNGKVQVYPNLGYGRFGAPISMANAPYIQAGLNITRLRMADLDGSGTTDLIYLDGQQAYIWFNQSGNSFSAPQRLTLPLKVNSLNQVQFADVYGQGTACMIVSQEQPNAAHFVYDFCATEGKPYLLQRVDNNAGAYTTTTYRSSTEYYLEDKANGLEWISKLPYPVHLVGSTTAVDEISNTSLTTSYQYHHGYYDPVEREFKGFARVDKTNAEVFHSFDRVSNNVSNPAFLQAEDQAPVLTKTWYHTGVWESPEELLQQLQPEFFDGDSMAPSLPLFSTQFLDASPTAETSREACVALAGTELRSEMYGMDGTEQQANPYAVELSSTLVEQKQHQGDNKYAVFAVKMLESLALHYERNPADPMVEHSLNLMFDDYDHVLKSASIHYGRRALAEALPEQQELKAYWSHSEVINRVDASNYLLGIPLQDRSWNMSNLALPAGQDYFTWQQVYDAVQVPSGVLLGWSRAYYWEDTATVAPFGSVGPQVLPYRTEQVAFEERQIASLFGADFSPSDLQALLTEQGGYVSYPNNEVAEFPASGSVIAGGYDTAGTLQIKPNVTASGNLVLNAGKNISIAPGFSLPKGFTLNAKTGNAFWWDPGVRVFYHDDSQFYLPEAGVNQFNSGSKTTYDEHLLYVNSQSSGWVNQGTDVLNWQPAPDVQQTEQRITAFDYQRMTPLQSVDVNGIVHEAILDPLGAVVVNSSYKGNEGFDPLSSYQVLPPPPSIQYLLDNPTTYIQRAAAYFYSDHLSWFNAQQPMVSISLVASDYPDEDDAVVQSTISYSDGFGRNLQTKGQTEPNKAYVTDTNGNIVVDASTGLPEQTVVQDCWLASGQLVYNNQGLVVKAFEPYYIDTWAYVDDEQINKTGFASVTHYDPLGRALRVDSPKGFFTKTEFTAWENHTYDHNDTIKDAPYYQDNVTPVETGGLFYDPDITPAAIKSLQKASLCYNTPQTTVVDNQGQTLQIIVRNEGVVTTSKISQMLGYDEEKAQGLIDELTLKELLDFRAALTYKFQPETNADLGLSSPYASDNDEIVAMLIGIQTAGEENVTRMGYDISGNQLWEADTRLYPIKTVESVFAINGEALKTISNDTGTTIQLVDVDGKTLYVKDSRSIQGYTEYDSKRRTIAKRIVGNDGMEAINQVTERMVYGDSMESGTPVVSNAADRNMLGKPYLQFDSAGLQEFDEYDLQGHNTMVFRQYRKDYKTEANWNDTSSAALAVELEETQYSSQFLWDVVGNVKERHDPDGNRLNFGFHRSGRLKTVQMTDGVANITRQYLKEVTYDAFSQRSIIQFGNNVRRVNTFDPRTHELTRYQLIRESDQKVLEDRSVVYDGAGHIGQVTDAMRPIQFNGNEEVAPETVYTYDALYQLIEATGRELDAVGAQHNQGQQRYSSLADSQQVHNYRRQYSYDTTGNLMKLRHITRDSAYRFTRSNTISSTSNRVVLGSLCQDATVLDRSPNAFFDEAGNQVQSSALDSIGWNYRNNIRQAEAPGGVQMWFVYDATGTRVRKVVEYSANAKTEETKYLGTLVIQTDTDNGSVKERREASVGYTDFHIARYLHWTQGTGPSGTTFQIRYQFTGINDSIGLELDDLGQLLSYQEYYPFGGTAFVMGESEAEVKLSRYRYKSKERDQVSGLYCMGFRYYNAITARWMSSDPAGTADGLNTYLCTQNNPVMYSDPTGMGIDLTVKKKLKKKKKKIREPNWKRKTQYTIAKIRYFKEQGFDIPVLQWARVEAHEKRLEARKKNSAARITKLNATLNKRKWFSPRRQKSTAILMLEGNGSKWHITEASMHSKGKASIRNEIRSTMAVQSAQEGDAPGIDQQVLTDLKKLYKDNKKNINFVTSQVKQASPVMQGDQIIKPLDLRIHFAMGRISPSANVDAKNPPDPAHGIDSSLDDRGHLVPEAGVAPGATHKTNVTENIIAENRVVNQQFKKAFEDFAKDYADADDSRIVMTAHQPNYYSEAELNAMTFNTDQDKNYARKRPKSVTHYLIVNGDVKTALTLDNPLVHITKD